MAYKKLFWGFIFLLDFRIQGVDILPDIIGYIFFYQGLTLLEDRNKLFAKGKKYALPLIFISIFDIYQGTDPMNGMGSSIGILTMLLGFIIFIINLLMVYTICFGILSEAREADNLDLESQARNAWSFYLFASILTSFSFLLLGLLPVLFIVVFVVSIIAFLIMLSLMNKASRQLESVD